LKISQRREKNIANLKKKVLIAARDIYEKEGLKSLTVRKIAEKIDYSPGTIYLYFKDKQHIIHHLLEENLEDLYKKFSEIILTDNASEDLKNIFRTYIFFYLNDNSKFILSQMEFYRGKERYENTSEYSANSKIYEFCLKIIKKFLEKDNIQVKDPHIIYLSLYCIANGIISNLIRDPDYFWGNTEILVDFAIDTFLNGLKNK